MDLLHRYCTTNRSNWVWALSTHTSSIISLQRFSSFYVSRCSCVDVCLSAAIFVS